MRVVVTLFYLCLTALLLVVRLVSSRDSWNHFNKKKLHGKSILQPDETVFLYRIDELVESMQNDYDHKDINAVLNSLCATMKEEASQSFCIRRGPALSDSMVTVMETICNITIDERDNEKKVYSLSNRVRSLKRALLFECYIVKSNKLPSSNNPTTTSAGGSGSDRDIVVAAINQSRRKLQNLEMNMQSTVNKWFESYRKYKSWKIRVVGADHKSLLGDDLSIPILSNTKYIYDIVQNLFQPPGNSNIVLQFSQGSAFFDLPCDEDNSLFHCGLTPPNIKLVLQLQPHPSSS